MDTITIGIIGDFNPEYPLHPATSAAVQHAAALMGVPIRTEWLATDRTHRYCDYHGLWCSPGSPYRSMEGALTGIRYAREARLPFLGTCGGFQHTVLEYARHVMGLSEAMHAEYDPYASVLFVTPLACSPAGKAMHVNLDAGSTAARCYGAMRSDEEYYCNFGLNPAYEERMQTAGLRITGRDQDREPRIVELSDHPFFMGTLFVPQMRSTAETSHPIIRGFCRAVCECAAFLV
jgi:CTP synthase (UTP-ammonia lyase)